MPTKKTVPTEESNKKAPRSDQASASAEERTAARRKAASSSARKASGNGSVKKPAAAKTAAVAARQSNPASRKNAKSEAAPGESAVPQKQGGIAKSVERIVQEKITTEETSAPAPSAAQDLDLIKNSLKTEDGDPCLFTGQTIRG